ncbi:MAG: hypothetical protein LCH63_12775 [Candidatus Melainabacteria bacterium]|mgnify:CR=1 FL=1|jgi:hypothetical protein|uniref:Uncharacterized protein n=1 Tax=Candidatus Obscuribacter phosphatis TaxID=1906157 RepID=A0A8J7PD02_9BACT|nr:hypothetical protein [Candidatus Obscuribacter phosphatis]MCA0314691.1 hypothetical protein [Candidatus Melainabacteria bacterium]
MALPKNLSKYAGGLVVLVAASLMLGSIFDYVSGLIRIVSVIVTVVAVSWLAVFIMSRMKGSKSKRAGSTQPDQDDTKDEET